MKTLKETIVLTSVVLLLLLHAHAKLSAAVGILEDETVQIQNQLTRATLTAHCYSSENDFGFKHLAPFQSTSWSFKNNFRQTTKFYCDFVSPKGSGNYGVFTQRLRDYCNGYCLWEIKDSGPCLKKSVVLEELYCQPWKVPPKSQSSSSTSSSPTSRGQNFWILGTDT